MQNLLQPLSKNIVLCDSSTAKRARMAGFPYKHVLLVGSSSGIGRGMADRLIEAGIKVTAVGRRKERLDEFVHKHTQNRAHRLVFNVGDIGKAPQFAAE